MIIEINNFKKQLEIDGYSIVDRFLTSEEIDILTKAHSSDIPEDILHHDCAHSKTSEDIVYRNKVNSAIKKVFQPKIDNLFPQYKFINGFFLNKINSGKKSELGIHQDTVKSETNCSQSSYRIWCPLVDVDENNGCLKIVKGSHRLGRLSMTGGVAPSYSQLQIMKDYIVSLPMKAEQALIFHERILHGSFPNISHAHRLSAIANIRPFNSRLVYYFPDNHDSPSKIEIYEIQDNFFTDFDFNNKDIKKELSKLKSTRYLGNIKYEDTSLTNRKILEKLSNYSLDRDRFLLNKTKITIELILFNLKNYLTTKKRRFTTIFGKITHK